MSLRDDPQFKELKGLLAKGSGDTDRMLLLMEAALKKRRISKLKLKHKK